MIHIILNKIAQLWSNNKAIISDSPVENKTPTDDILPDLSDSLDTACAIFALYIREDGEFAITSEITRNNEAVMDMTGTILHMINSGLLSEYFLKSLHLWADENPEYQPLVRDVIKKWKMLYDEEMIDTESQSALAIDPSEVFSLKSLSEGDFK
jgi:hypothetical protein